MTTSFKPRYLEQRRNPQRPMINITMRLPEDVIDDLKQIAPRVGLRGYRVLIRAYIGQGLAQHVTEINQRNYPAVAAALQRRGWNEEDIAALLNEIQTDHPETA
jgi:hypothetical protein